MKLQTVRGTRDLLGLDMCLYRYIETQARQLSEIFGFSEIQTPIFEFTDVFHRTLGETSDVVHKETYTFTDRSGDSLTLRPEGTAGIARCFISEGLSQQLPLKFYYSGPMFRHERPQKGRYRQFHQLGVESLGFESPDMDVECISLAFQILEKLKIHHHCRVQINTLGDSESRQKYRQSLFEYFSKYKTELSADSQLRLEKNPLRILDSKAPEDKKIITTAPKMSLTLDAEHFFQKTLKGLQLLKIPFELNPQLVRGLDYYTHTVFEIITDQLGAQGTVLAGGRYDGLIATMGGPITPGIGWAAGIERLSELVSQQQNIMLRNPDIAVLAADQEGEVASLILTNELRQKGIFAENILTGSSIGKKLKRADKLQARWAVILGQKEVETGQLSVKDLKTGEQQTLDKESLFKKLSK